MMKLLLRSIFCGIFLFSIFIIFSIKAPNASADGACKIDSISWDTTGTQNIGNGPFFAGQFGSNVLPNTPFSLTVSCNPFLSAQPQNVTVTVGGISVTKTGLTGVLGQTFGPFSPGLPFTETDPNRTIQLYPATFNLSIETPPFSCFGTNAFSCNVMVDGGGGLGPVAVPLPLPNCLSLRGYNPAPPVIGKPFQIQFILNNTNLSNGIGRYKVDYTISGGVDGSADLVDATAFAGIWVVNMPAIIGEFNWKVIFDGNPCGVIGMLFPGADGGLGPGHNPCVSGSCQTAIGNFSTNIKSFSSQFLSMAIGLAGGLALILMVRGSISVLMSQGDPQKTNAGREVIIAAAAGLLFLIFSVLILRFLGLNILGGIPGI